MIIKKILYKKKSIIKKCLIKKSFIKKSRIKKSIIKNSVIKKITDPCFSNFFCFSCENQKMSIGWESVRTEILVLDVIAIKIHS